MSATARIKRWFYLVHRWLGIGLAVVMVAWFVSGMVMLYVGYPKLTRAERLAALPPLPAAGCCVPLQQAAAAARQRAASAPSAGRRAAAGEEAWRLTSVAGRPRYVFGDEGPDPVAVDALDGRVIGAIGPDEATAAARHFAAPAPVRWLGRVDEDAWTHSRALDGHRPLHAVEVDEPEGRLLYVSGRTGEVVRDASRSERTWGWVGAWLHWLYLFRGGALDRWWTEIVIWLAVAGCVSCVTGLVVGVWRWRFRGTYRSGRRTPYADRAGRWHHLAGLAGGVLALTWVLSGLLSMNPWKVFDGPGPRPDRQAYAGGRLDPSRAPDPARVLQQLAGQGVAVREITWRRVGDEHLAEAHGAGRSRLVGTAGLPIESLPESAWRAAAGRLLGGARVVAEERLERWDAYYYGREPHTMGGHRDRPLPVWRLHFDDPGRTWVVIDPRTGAVLQTSDARRRVDRWLFAFLHSFDLPALLALRPGWDLWMLGFSLAGTLLAATALVTGTRRLLRPWRRSAGPDAAAMRPTIGAAR